LKTKNKKREKELNEEEWHKAVYNLAYDFLTIKECPNCRYPYVSGWRCSNCGYDIGDWMWII